MWRELDVAGIFLPPLLAYMALAFVIQVGLYVLIGRARLARFVWNTPLAEAGVYVCILALLTVFL